MRGEETSQGAMFSYVSLEERVPADHPLRPIREMTDEVLSRLSGRFDELYARVGRPSIPPERLLRALLLQLFYSIRSERLLMEQLHYNLLFRWFVGLSMDDPIWAPTVFTKNRDRLTRTPRRRTPTRGCIGGRIRPNRLAYLGHLLIENRHGVIVDAMATVADGYTEREAATLMVHDQWQRAPGAGGRSGPTKATTPSTSWTGCGRSGRRRTWRRTARGGAAVRSMGARRAIRATRRVSMPALASSRPSAGSRRSLGCAR